MQSSLIGSILTEGAQVSAKKLPLVLRERIYRITKLTIIFFIATIPPYLTTIQWSGAPSPEHNFSFTAWFGTAQIPLFIKKGKDPDKSENYRYIPFHSQVTVSSQTMKKLPTQVMSFYCHTKTRAEIIICQKISRYKPNVKGSEHGLELYWTFLDGCLYPW